MSRAPSCVTFFTTDGGNQDDKAHHWGVALWIPHCEAGIGSVPPIPSYQNLLFSVARGGALAARASSAAASLRILFERKHGMAWLRKQVASWFRQPEALASVSNDPGPGARAYPATVAVKMRVPVARTRAHTTGRWHCVPTPNRARDEARRALLMPVGTARTTPAARRLVRGLTAEGRLAFCVCVLFCFFVKCFLSNPSETAQIFCSMRETILNPCDQ